MSSWQRFGYWIAQLFDVTDKFGDTIDETCTQRMFGARYEWVIGADGIPVQQTVAGTDGPIAGLFPWPAKGPRTLAQLSWVFPAKITSAGKATPVKTGDGSGWTAATDLDEMSVFTSDGSAPTVGAFGLVIVGTELGAQNPLFFQGGGGSSETTYKVTANNADGTYTLQAYDRKGGSTVGSPVLLCEELNLAVSVPVNAWVRGFLESDSVIRFSLPLGCT